MHLARFRVDKVGLDLVTVPPEEGIRERAITPVQPGAMQVDEQPRHRVEQTVPICARAEGEAHQQAAVLEGVDQEIGHEDRGAALVDLREPNGRNGGEALVLEMSQCRELALGDIERFFLQGERRVVRLEEANEMPRGTNRDVPEAVVVPLGER